MRSLCPFIPSEIRLTFLKTELLDHFSGGKDTEVQETQSSVVPGDVVGIREADFTWSSEQDGIPSSGMRRRKFVLHIADELIFERGCINLILGPTGSGKTSLLMALLGECKCLIRIIEVDSCVKGEMHYIPTGPNSSLSLPRDRGVAYAAQESWVQNETIKVRLHSTPSIWLPMYMLEG